MSVCHSVCCVRTFFTFWDIHTFSSTNIWALLLLCECVYMSKSSFDTDNPSLVRHVLSCLMVLVVQPTMSTENQAQMNYRVSLSLHIFSFLICWDRERLVFSVFISKIFYLKDESIECHIRNCSQCRTQLSLCVIKVDFVIWKNASYTMSCKNNFSEHSKLSNGIHFKQNLLDDQNLWTHPYLETS